MVAIPKLARAAFTAGVGTHAANYLLDKIEYGKVRLEGPKAWCPISHVLVDLSGSPLVRAFLSGTGWRSPETVTHELNHAISLVGVPYGVLHQVMRSPSRFDIVEGAALIPTAAVIMNPFGPDPLRHRLINWLNAVFDRAPHYQAAYRLAHRFVHAEGGLRRGIGPQQFSRFFVLAVRDADRG